MGNNADHANSWSFCTAETPHMLLNQAHLQAAGTPVHPGSPVSMLLLLLLGAQFVNAVN